MMQMEHFLGIPGLTVAAGGIWTIAVLIIGGVIRQWVMGIADRKRADNEGMTAKERASFDIEKLRFETEVAREKANSDARTLLFNQMHGHMERMQEQITLLQQRVFELEQDKIAHLRTIAELKGGQYAGV